jgi:dipeptidyl aminopeptidase/acylaminoacyl peptidase
VNRELRRELQQLGPPEELEAQRRAWPTIRAAFETRERVDWSRRHVRLLVAVAAAVGLVVAAQAVAREVRDAFDDEGRVVRARPVLDALPARGPLLVTSPRGAWIVRRDGSRRLLGRYQEASWSPQARFVVVSRRRELRAVDPRGNLRWTIERGRRITGARWSPDGFRVAYLSGSALRVAAGDGSGDKELRRRVFPAPPAWRPSANHELAFATVDGRVALVQTDTGAVRWRADPGLEPPRELTWSEDGRRLLALGERSLRVLDDRGRELWRIGLPIGPSGVAFVRKSHRFLLIRWVPATGRSELVLLQAEAARGEERSLFSAAGQFGSLAVSPDGRWALAGWVNADQWLFLRLDRLRVRAISGISEKFGSRQGSGPLASVFPSDVSWCCPPSP